MFRQDRACMSSSLGFLAPPPLRALEFAATISLCMLMRSTKTTMTTPQGKDSEAEPLHERALQLREALLGSTHPDVATSLEFLARMALKSGALRCDQFR